MESFSTTDMLNEAIRLGQERRYRKAIPLLLRIITKDESQTEALLYLGRSYHALGDFALAVDALRKFSRLNPQSAAGHFFLGRSLLAAGIPRAAAQQLDASLKIKPNLSRAKILLAYAMVKLQYFDAGSDLLGEAVEQDPDNKSLYDGYLNTLFLSGIQHFKKGDYPYSQEVFEFLLQKGIRHILPHLYLGMIYRNTGDIAAALQAYEQALSYSPKDELILYRTAILNVQMGYEKRGKELLTLLKEYYPNSPLFNSREAEYAMALQYLQREEYEQALALALSLLKQNSRDIQIRLIVAECYRELGEHERSMNHYHRAIERAPQNLHAHFGLSMLWWQQGNFHEAEKQLNVVLHIDPRNESAQYYLVLSRNREDIEAQDYLEEIQEAIHRFGPDELLLSAIAETYIRMDQHKKAETWYRKALKFAPRSKTALRGLILLSSFTEIKGLNSLFSRYLAAYPQDIQIYKRFVHHLFDAGEYEKAAKRIEKLLPHMKDNQRLGRMRAICYRKIGDFSKAALLYKGLLRQAPEKEEYLRPYIYCLQKSGHSAQAEHTLAAALDYMETPSVELYLIFGVMQFRKGQLNLALQAFRNAQDANPRDWRIFFNMAEVYREKNMESYADSFYQKAEKLKEAGQ